MRDLKVILTKWKGHGMKKLTKETDKLKNRTEKFNKALQIYLEGYATHKDYDAETWFAAREFVMENKHLTPRFKWRDI